MIRFGTLNSEHMVQALHHVRQDLEVKKGQLEQEVVTSHKFKHVYKSIQSSLFEVSDCITPSTSARFVRKVGMAAVWELPTWSVMLHRCNLFQAAIAVMYAVNQCLHCLLLVHYSK